MEFIKKNFHDIIRLYIDTTITTFCMLTEELAIVPLVSEYSLHTLSTIELGVRFFIL